MDLVWLIHGTMPLRFRIGRLRRARALIRERLADAEIRVEGLRADLERIGGALADYGGPYDTHR